MDQETREEIKKVIENALVFGLGIFQALDSEGLEMPLDSILLELIDEAEKEMGEKKCL